MNRLFPFVQLILLFCAFSLFGIETHPTGTLIVTYQTGNKAERLDRIRFWIRNERQAQHMYPKGSAYIDDPETMTRMVVIEDLPPGNYSLEFLVPNTDNLFDALPLREFTVTPKNVVKIDQQIKPRYASLQVKAAPLDKKQPFSVAPAITLKDQYGKIQAQSAVGKLRANDLAPGGYTVIFEELEGYDAPNPVTITLGPNETKGPIVGKYQIAKPRKEHASQYALQQHPISENYYGQAILDTENFAAIDTLIPEFTLSGGVQAGVKLPPDLRCERVYPTISVMDSKGRIAGRSSNGSLIVEDLEPGEYQVVFGELEGCIAPKKTMITIKAGEMIGPIFGEYTLPTGKLVVRYESHSDETPLDRICFSLKDEEGNKTVYPQVGRVIEDPLTGGKLVVIQCLQAGDYCVEFSSEEDDEESEPIAIHEVKIRPNRTQTIHQVFEKTELEEDSPAKDKAEPEGGEIAQNTIIINYPEYPYESYGYITVGSNMPDARWTLYDNNFKITTGSGSSQTVRVRTGTAFQVKPERINGYEAEVRPTGRFTLLTGDSYVVEIIYTPTVGYIEIHTQLPAGEFLQGKIVPEDERGEVIPFKVMSEGQSIRWKSPGLFTGNYTVYFETPLGFEPAEPENVRVIGRRTAFVKPRFATMGSIKVTTNIPEAVYTLRSESDDEEWAGQGSTYIFKGLPEGQYTIEFSSEESQFYAPPEPKRVFLGKSGETQVRARYEIGGGLKIIGDIDRFRITVEEVYGNRRTWEKTVVNGAGAHYLPEGRYRLSFQPLVSGYQDAKPIEVRVKPLQTKEVTVLFPKAKQGKVIEAKEVPEVIEEVHSEVTVTSNIPEISFSVKDQREDGEVRPFTGNYVVVPLEPDVEYQVEFSDVSGYTTPPPKMISVKQGEKAKIKGSYHPKSELLSVPAGIVKLGGRGTNVQQPETIVVSSFLIGTYEVTNEEFAFWLNLAHRDGKIKYYIEGDMKGAVVDTEDHVLFRTQEGNNRSRITAFGEKMQIVEFHPLPDRQKHPVNYVSWHGANAYCKDLGYRLPTEAEWVKAAGMSLEDPLKKYEYGFGRNEIDPTWANYKFKENGDYLFSTRTTPVGFYNGKNALPLMPDVPEQQITHDAKSPVGAYDMSGNVWEWTADWYGKDPDGQTKKAAKGGCFDSTAEGVRISERIGLPPDHLDEFTGFRVVKDIK